MIIALALFGYAALLLTAGPRALGRARWPDGAPRLAIAAWFALTGSAIFSVIAGGLALMLPTVRISIDLADLMSSCMIALRAQCADPAGAALTGAGAVLVLAVPARLTWCTYRALAQAARTRRRHWLRLSLIGKPDSHLGAVIIGHREPAAYCLPGSGNRIVLTTGAVRALDEIQLRAVLAHERAHLRGRHHLLITLAGALTAAFPLVSTFRVAVGHVALLAELRADDAASAVAHRLSVVAALLTLGTGVPAAAALGAGTADAARVRRLIDGPAAVSRTRVAAVVSSAVAVVLVPLLLLAGPAAAAWGMYCVHDTVPAVAAAPSCGHHC